MDIFGQDLKNKPINDWRNVTEKDRADAKHALILYGAYFTFIIIFVIGCSVYTCFKS